MRARSSLSEHQREQLVECFEQGMSYGTAAKTLGVSKMDLAREFDLSSGQLVDDWSRTWRKGGDDALKPKPKGRPKGSSAPKRLTEEEKLRRQIERLEAENAYLKKLRDLRNQGHV